MVHLNKQLVLPVLLIHGIIFIPSEAHTASTEAITATIMSSYRSIIMRRFSREQKNGKNPFHHKRTPAISSDIIMIDGDRLQVNNSLFTPNEVLLKSNQSLGKSMFGQISPLKKMPTAMNLHKSSEESPILYVRKKAHIQYT